MALFNRTKGGQVAKDYGGPARVDSRTKRLVKRLEPGDVAIIDHEDIDLVSAESLVACRPAAVLNAAKSTSGAYPNMGPGIIISNDVPLIDNLGPAIMEMTEGESLTFDMDGRVLRGDEVIATGIYQTAQTNEADLERAHEGMADQLKAFAENTMEYVELEQELFFSSVGVPDIDTEFQGRQALIVVRGYHYKEDLASLRSYIREYRPVLIGVDGGADAILDIGMKPDMIVGDMDSVSDRALTCGAEVVVHAYRDGSAPGKSRVEALGVPAATFPMTGTSEDVAMILADAKGASLIVAVGTHSTLIEFLDKGRKGMASTFLTRLRLGGKLIDAKGASQLYRSRVSGWQLLALVIAGFLAIIAAIATTAAGQTVWGLIQTWFSDVTLWFRNLF